MLKASVVQGMVTCPNCGAEFHDSERFCPECGQPRSAIHATIQRLSRLSGREYDELAALARKDGLPELTRGQREIQLNDAVRLFVGDGYQVLQKDSRSATLRKAKSFSFWWWFLLTIVTFGLALVLLAILYVSRSDESAFIEVDRYGEITVTGDTPNKLRRDIGLLNGGKF